MKRRRHTAVQERAFTLVEVLLALALLAALLAALNHFTFSITDLWARRQEQVVFQQHARAVGRRIDAMLRTAADNARRSGATTGATEAGEIAVPEGGRETLLLFDLPAGDPVMAWPERPLPEVSCALGWRNGEGLILYWKSRLELDFDTAAPRKTVLSSFVTGISYDYYDTESQTWEQKDELRESGTTVETPGRIRLRFQRKQDTIEEIIIVPDPAVEGVPAF